GTLPLAAQGEGVRRSLTDGVVRAPDDLRHDAVGGTGCRGSGADRTRRAPPGTLPALMRGEGRGAFSCWLSPTELAREPFPLLRKGKVSGAA
ncbi:MAG: hypothetical protein ACK5X3_06750, partial [Pseudomonadota bacterium]